MMLLTSTFHLVADVLTGASSLCPLCGGSSTSATGDVGTWLLMAGLGAAVVVRAVLRRRDATTKAAPPSSTGVVGGSET